MNISSAKLELLKLINHLEDEQLILQLLDTIRKSSSHHPDQNGGGNGDFRNKRPLRRPAGIFTQTVEAGDRAMGSASEVVVLHRMFGSRGSMDAVAAARRNLLQLSYFSPPFDGTSKSPALSIEEAADALHDSYVKAVAGLTPEGRLVRVVRDGKEEQIDVSDVTEVDVGTLERTADGMGKYTVAKMTDPKTFAIVANAAVKGTRFRSRKVDTGEIIEDNPFIELIEGDGMNPEREASYAKSEVSKTNEIYVSSEKRNPSHFASRSKQLALSGIPLMEVTEGIGQMTIREVPGMVADWETAEVVLLRAAAYARMNPAKRPVDAIAEKLYETWRMDKKGKFGRHAITLYMRFFAPPQGPQGSYVPQKYTSVTDARSGRGPSTYSYRQFVENPSLFDGSITNDTERVNVAVKHAGATDLFNSMVSHYMSRVTAGYIKYMETIGKDSEGPDSIPVTNVIRLSFDEGTSEKDNLRRHLKRFFLPSPNGVVISSDVRSRFILDGLDYGMIESDSVFTRIKVNADGIFLVRKNPDGSDMEPEHIVYFKNRYATLVHRDLSPVGIEVYRDFFDAVGYPIAAGAVERMYESSLREEDSNFDEGSTGENLLAYVIATWSSAVYGSVAEITGQKGDPAVMKHLQNAKKRGYSPDFWAQEGASMVDLPTPDAFFVANNQVAYIQTSAKGSEYSKRMMNEDGEPEFVNNVGDLFQNSIPSGVLPNRAQPLVMNYPVLAQRDKALTTVRDGVEQATLPLMDKDHWFKLSGSQRVMGIQVEDYEGHGAPANLQPIEDQVGAELDTFAQELLRRDGWVQEVVLRLPPYANRKPQTVAYTSRDKSKQLFLIKRETVDGKNVVTSAGLNYQLVGDLFVKQYEYVIRTKEESLKRISEFIQERTQTQYVAKGHASSLNDLLSAAGGDLSVIRNSNLREGLDYVIKGGELLLGRAGKRGGLWGLEAAQRVVAAGRQFKADLDASSKAIAEAGKNAEQREKALDAQRTVLANNQVIKAVWDILTPYYVEFDAWMAVSGKRKNVKDPPTRLDLRKQSQAWSMLQGQAYDDLLKGYFIVNTVVSTMVTTSVVGPLSLFDGVPSLTKRLSSATSVQWGANVGLPAIRSSFVIMDDPAPRLHSDSGSVYKPMDGQAIFTPWGYMYMLKAHGNDLGVMNRGVAKMIMAQYGTLVKAAWGEPTAQFYLYNKKYQGWIRRYLSDKVGHISGRNLLEMWNEALGQLPDMWQVDKGSAVEGFSERYARAVEMIMSETLMDNEQAMLATGAKMPATFFATPESVKYGATRINPDSENGFVGPDGKPLPPMGEVEFDARNFGFQVDLSRSEEDMGAAQLNQLYEMVNGTPGNEHLMARLKELDEASVGRFTEMLEKVMGSGPPEERTMRLRNWMREATLRSAEQQTGSIQLLDALSDRDMDINSPIVMKKIVSYILSKVRTEAFNPRLYGQQYTQHSAEGIKVPVPQPDGSVQHRELLPPRTEKYMDGTVERTRYVPGEVIARLPQDYIDAFGITDLTMTPAEMEQDIRNRLGDEAADLFSESLTVYVSRTPASGVASGQWMRIVGFISDASNTMYMSAGINGLTGGDFDGDQLTTLFTQLSGQGKNVRRKEQGSNEYLEIFREFYMGEKSEGNIGHIFSSIGTRRIEEAVNNDPRTQEGQGQQGFGTMGTSIASREEIQAGQGSIAIFIAQNKSFSSLLGARSLIESLVKAGKLPERAIKDAFPSWSPEAVDSTGRHYRVENFREFLNTARDNMKLALMGRAGINKYNAPIVVGMLASGASIDEIINFILSPEVVAAVEAVGQSKRYLQGGFRSAGIDIHTAAKKVQMNPAIREKILSYVRLSEQMRRYAMIIGLKKNGLGPDHREFMGIIQNIEFSLGGNLEDILSGNVTKASSDAFVTARTVNNEEAQYEMEIRSTFDLYEVIRNDRGIMAQLGLIAKVKDMFSRSFTMVTPAMQKFELSLARKLGQSFFFERRRSKAYERSVMEWMAADYLSSNGAKDVILSDGFGRPPIDLTTHEGRNWFIARFPDHWTAVMNAMMNDPIAREKLKNNRFLSEVRVIREENGFRTLEMEDSRRLHGDQARNIAVDDLVDLSNLHRSMSSEGKLDLTEDAWDADLLEQLYLYSMLKDRFSMSKSSLYPLMPASAGKSFAAYLGSKLGTAPDEAFVEDFLVANPRFVPFGSSDEGKMASYIRKSGVIRSRKADKSLFPINRSPMALYSPGRPANVSNIFTVPGSAMHIMDAVLLGKNSVEINEYIPDKVSEVVIPTGERVPVSASGRNLYKLDLSGVDLSNQRLWPLSGRVQHGGTLY